MISTDLSNLSDWVITWAAKNEPMPPPKAAHLSIVLMDLSRQVQHMERMAIAVDAFIYADKDDCDAVL